MAGLAFACLYFSYMETFAPFTDAERGRIMMAMIEYASTGVVPDFEGNERFIWPTIQAQIDRDVVAYEKRCEKNRSNGAKGGRPRKQTQTEETQKTERFSEKPKKAKDKDNDKNNDKEKDKNNKVYSDVPELNQAILSFIEFRKSIKKPMTDHAVELLFKKLNDMTTSIDDQIEIINQSIVNGWQGVFPLKEQKTQQIRPGYHKQTKAEELDDFYKMAAEWSES